MTSREMIGKAAAADMETAEPEESVLFRQFQQGRLAAYEQLFDRYSPRIYNYIRRVTNDCTAAEDLVQETFLRVFTHARRLGSDTNFSAWLYRIATNLCRDYFRQSVRRKRASEQLLRASVDAEANEKMLLERERTDQLTRALGNLPADYQAALLLKYMEGLSYCQIGVVLSMSEAAVTSLLYRARTELRDLCESARGGR
jgi:RNA polymerase sigma-70 factor, ECF subfamily